MPTIVRLVDCDPMSPRRYIALSHCWGDSGTVQKTILANIEQHQNGLQVSSLSKTFRDAMNIVMSLGETCLWIDSLCIIQDSAADWQSEIARMGKIYEGSVLTLSATTARDGRDGYWVAAKKSCTVPYLEHGSLKHLNIIIERTRLQGNVGHIKFLQSWPDWHATKTKPLTTRKWAFQERLLSPRTLHFSDGGMIWECCKTVSIGDEDAANGELTDDDSLDIAVTVKIETRYILSQQGTTATDDYISWTTLVMAYSKGLLTRETDVFPAFSGLARAFTRKGLGKYYAGLWRSSLPYALCWLTHGRLERSARNQLYKRAST